MPTAKMYLNTEVDSFRMTLAMNMEKIGALNLMTARSPRGIIVTAAILAMVPTPEVHMNAKTYQGLENRNRFLQPS